MTSPLDQGQRIAMPPSHAQHSRRFGKRGEALRVVVILTAIAALLWQSFIVQTHIHHAAPAVHAAPGIGHARHPAEAPADCPICREIAQAAAYLTPTLPALVAPAPAYVLLAEPPIAATICVAFAPAWRSRAPPLHLRA